MNINHSGTTKSDLDLNDAKYKCKDDSSRSTNHDSNETQECIDPCKTVHTTSNSLPEPPDGGWGWVVVVGSFIVHACWTGLYRSSGALYLGLRTQFPEASNAELTSVMSTSVGVGLFLSPAAAALMQRGVSARQLIMIAGGVAATGGVVASFANSINGLRSVLAVFFGITSALSHLPTITLVGHYFEKRRSLAMAISLTGMGIGGLAFPPLFVFIVEEFSLFGAFFLIGGILLHISLGGMLHRPLQHKLNPISKETKNEALSKPWSLEKLRLLPRRLLDGVVSSELLRPSVAIYIFSQALHLGVFWASLNFLPTLAFEAGIGKVEAASLLSFNAGFLIAGRLICGFATDSPALRPHRLFVLLLVLVFGAAINFGVVFAASFGLMAVYSSCHGLVIGSAVLLRYVVLQDIVGRETFASANALYNVCAAISSVAVPPLCGALVDAVGAVSSVYWFTAVEHLFCAGCAAAILLCERKRNE